MGTIIQTKGNRAARAGQLVAGARKHFANGGQVLAFAGALANVTVDAACDELNTLVTNRAASTAARATARDKVATEEAAMPALVAFMNAFEGLIRIMFANDSTSLADFGLQPRKQPVPKTAAEKAVAAAKAAATREARGTKGPKAKKAVKGNVTAQVVVTPLTTVAAPAPAAPAQAPAPTTGGTAPAAPPKG
ncbi:MAG: hypothetical protein ABSE49_32955 [Polyangiaceae bacterium]|jgi:hypothetical protein